MCMYTDDTPISVRSEYLQSLRNKWVISRGRWKGRGERADICTDYVCCVCMFMMFAFKWSQLVGIIYIYIYIY